jgi:hypothetical protein
MIYDNNPVTMSDRELDARVAEAVFGWRWWRYTFSQGDAEDYRNMVVRSLHPPDWPPQTDQWREWGDEAGFAPADGTEPIHRVYGMGDAMFVGELPAFCTDMAAAWLVVAELTRIGIPFAIEDSAASGTWRADFGGIAVTGEHERRDGAPRAICLAALAVLTSVAKAKGQSHAQR